MEENVGLPIEIRDNLALHDALIIDYWLMIQCTCPSDPHYSSSTFMMEHSVRLVAHAMKKSSLTTKRLSLVPFTLW